MPARLRIFISQNCCLRSFAVCVILVNLLLIPTTLRSVRKPKPGEQRKFYPKTRLKMVKQSYLVSFYHTDVWLQELISKFHPRKCEYANCIVTEDRSLLSSSDAVVFHGVHLNRVPPILRKMDQVWIILGLESPLHYSHNYTFPSWRNAFNWTMTYRKDSDIYFPYSEIVLKERVSYNRNYSYIYKKKKHLLAWPVSNCNAHSLRDQYVESLKRYVPDIRIYGKCGQLSCGAWENSEDCYQMIGKEHKFVLSFENSLCHDYITEKAFLPYTTDLIPVVRGRAQYRDYLPSGTYIDTRDFTTVKSLTERLLYLGSHSNEYLKLLKEKDLYEIRRKELTFQKAICKVCQKLNNLSENRKVYPNIKQWLWKDGGCVYPNDVIDE